MSKLNLTTEVTESTKKGKNVNELTELVIGCAIEVHRTLGPGLLESAHEVCLCRELSLRGIPFEPQVAIPMEYKGVKLDCGYRADLLVAGKIVVEIKAVDQLAPIHEALLLGYLKLTGLKVGLLINFNERADARYSPQSSRPARSTFFVDRFSPCPPRFLW